MAPNSVLNGLNIIQQPSDAPADGIDLLQGVPSYADLAAQLDLWTNVSFASDEPFGPSDSFNDVDGGKFSDKEEGSAGEEMKRKRAVKGGRKFPAPSSPERSEDQHTSTQEQQLQPQPQPQPATIPNPAIPNPFISQPPFDFSTLLAMTGMDPMKMNPFITFPPFMPQNAFPFQLPTAAPLPTPSVTASTLGTASDAPSAPSSAPSAPKRPRVRASSTSTNQKSKPSSPTTATSSTSSDKSNTKDHDDEDEDDDEDHEPGRTLTAAEDKRRRNTQASARFRLKKKEREAAMEQKCKELSIRVSELEKECEALRRENGWLKGLVVGVTGGNGAMPGMSLPGMPMMGSAGLPPPPASAPGVKRKADDA